MIEIKEKIDLVINQIDNNTDLFYKNKSDEGYNEFINTISRIDEFIVSISKLENKETGENYIIRISEILKEAMDAMEKKDTTLLSDILLYDLKEFLIEIKESLL